MSAQPLHTKPVTAPNVAKVPLVMQMEATECGAASLAMVLAYYGKWIQLEKLRADCGVSRDGASAKNVLKAARHHGLTAKAMRAEIEGLRKFISYPAIVFLDFSHFAVMTGIKGNTVYLNDPAKGRVKMPLEKFSRKFSGLVLIFKPSADFEPSGSAPKVYKFALRRLRGIGPALVFACLVIAAISLLQFFTPGFSRVFLDWVLSGSNSDWLMPLVAIMAIVGILTVVFSYIQELYLLKIEGKLALTGRAEFFWHLLNLPIEFFAQRSVGDVVSRERDYAVVANTLARSFAPVAVQVVMMIVYLEILLYYSVPLALIGVVSVFLNVWAARVVSNKRIDIMRVYSREVAHKDSILINGIQMIANVKSAGAEVGYFATWADHQAVEKKALVNVAEVNSKLGVIPSLLSSLSNVLVLAFGAVLIGAGELTTGMLLASQGFLSQFYQPVSSLINTGQTLEESRTKMERIDDVLNYRSDKDHALSTDEEAKKKYRDIRFDGHVSMKDVTFGYSPLADPVLKNFSMELTPGKTVALVGSSGCGKSTVTKLLSGLYTPWEGDITFNGVPLAEIPGSILASIIAVADQDIVIFPDTVKNNIKMWDDSSDDFPMKVAARDAQIHFDIMSKPGGYEAVLNESGASLSGGQRQRIEIARALAMETPILVLDEATSALDAQTEYHLMQRVRAREITCVIVAHRLSTVRDCDEIIVLDHGEIVERGTHAELVELGGTYLTLITDE